MNGIRTFLRELRYQPAVSALIPVDLCMGIPSVAEEGRIYIPFYKPEKPGFWLLAAEIWADYPAFGIYRYQRVEGAACVCFEETWLSKRKKEFLEEMEHDKYTSGI